MKKIESYLPPKTRVAEIVTSKLCYDSTKHSNEKFESGEEYDGLL